MAVLVGIYLLDCTPVPAAEDGPELWAGEWSLFRSPSGNRKDWVSLSSGRTAAAYGSPSEAAMAAQEAGAQVARSLQADDGLEPMRWPPKQNRRVAYSPYFGYH